MENQKLDSEGYVILPAIVPAREVSTLLAWLSALDLGPLRGGIRRIERQLPAVAALATAERLLNRVRPCLPGEPQLVRAIYFDKSPRNNWSVTWHQDRTVSVRQRFRAAGWKAWSVKAGAWHVQPPLAVLENMATLRLHLDPADRENGCLKVLPGSHRKGVLAAAEMQVLVDRSEPVFCEVPAGGALMMRPLILHASEKVFNGKPRRVLHFEYSCHRLPEGIAWAA